MRRDQWQTCAISALVATLLSSSAVACMVTAFGLQSVDPVTVGLWCAGVSLVCSFCFLGKWWFLPLSAAGLLAGILWHTGSLERSLESVLYQLSVTYDQAYHWGVLSWNGTPDAGQDINPALCAIGTLIAAAVCTAVCRRKSVVLAVGVALLPLLSCLVVTDRLPDRLWLYLLLVGITVLALTGAERRQDVRQANRLTVLVTVPVCLAVALLFWAVPQDGYTGQAGADRISNAVLQWLPEDWRQIGTGTTVTGLTQSDVMDLRRIGPRYTTRRAVMEVTAEQGGRLYLRAQCMDQYDGIRWKDSGSVSSLDWPYQGVLRPAGKVTIRTRSVQPMLYQPYYPKGVWSVGNVIPNHDGQTEYTYECMALAENFATYMWDDDFYQTQQNLYLPATTRSYAEEILRTVVNDKQNPLEKAEAIRQFVLYCAEYDTDTERMPSGETDFVRWFLEEADTGYCIHFASTAAVLLRGAGIPARYVSGYMVQTEPGKTVTVRDENAHAWVEYWVRGIGWLVLEATPVAEQTPVTTPDTRPEETTAPQPTEPSMEETVDSTTDTVTTTPTQPDTDASEKETVSGKLVWTVVALLLMTGLVVGQWRLRVVLRNRRLTRGTTNARAVARWQEAVRLSRLLGERPDGGLFEIAQKARFSQYILEEAELASLDAYIRAARRKLRRKPWYYRAFCRLVLAIY